MMIDGGGGGGTVDDGEVVVVEVAVELMGLVMLMMPFFDLALLLDAKSAADIASYGGWASE